MGFWLEICFTALFAHGFLTALFAHGFLTTLLT
jgi:hypothetical protein